MKSIKKVNEINYDRAVDVLYLTFSNMSNSYGDEDIDNIVFFKDIDSEEITGITILNFLKMYKRNDSRLRSLNKFIDVNHIATELAHS